MPVRPKNSDIAQGVCRTQNRSYQGESCTGSSEDKMQWWK